MSVFNYIGGFLTLIGALGLFLFGMKLMSEALQKVAGGKMRSILSSMTSNRFKGLLTGFLVTTVIQSSSATTVMVVSFVNAGLLSLLGAVGVIMGANIGTTVTAWIISILGFKIQMSVLSLPLIGMGFPLFFAKGSRNKAWGEFIIGFAILFLGLQFLKDSVPDIRNNPEALSFLSGYINMGYLSIALFVFIGTILTVIIQSSSATMALTLVLCYNGLINFEVAAAMVLGENIGTTITANMAAIVANTSAKRAARAHFLFNFIGVTWMLILYYPFLRGIDKIMMDLVGFSVLNPSYANQAEFEAFKLNLPMALAIFHTSFNIINSVVLVGFAKKIASLAERMVPSKEDDEEFRLKYISAGMYSTSELMTLQAKKEIVLMAERTRKMFNFVPELLLEKKEKRYHKLLERVNKYEDIVDRMEVEIARFVTKISESDLSSEGSKRIRAMLKIIDDIESIGDVSYQMAMNIDAKNQQKVWFTQEMRDELNVMFLKIDAAIEMMIDNLSGDYHKIEETTARNLEKEINQIRNKLRLANVESLKHEKYSYETGGFYSSLISQSEKVGDYVDNVTDSICECK